MKKIGMLGGGSWGTAAAQLLASNGHEVILWCYEPDVTQCITKVHCNDRYLPDVKLSPLITPTIDLKSLFDSTDIVFEAIPVAHMRSVLQTSCAYIHDRHSFVVLSKGLEQETLRLPSQIIEDIFGVTCPVAVVAGPSFAREVACRAITALTVASLSDPLIAVVRQLMNNDYCRTFSCSDSVGVQVAGACKNVVALGLGILEGANIADNTKAFMFTLGLAEIAACAKVLGGRPETLYGLAGIGDLMLTCRGRLSRNAYVGQCLGNGKTIEQAIKELGTIPESLNTVCSVYQLAEQYKLELPLFKNIYEVVQGNMTLDTFLNLLVHGPVTNIIC